MPVRFFKSEEADNPLPWVEAYVETLDKAKKGSFCKTIFLVKRGNSTERGFILETEEFKFWMWKSESSVLATAFKGAFENGEALVVMFTKNAKGLYKPTLGLDSDQGCVVTGDLKKAFSVSHSGE
jgi:hypothetical protein